MWGASRLYGRMVRTLPLVAVFAAVMGTLAACSGGAPGQGDRLSIASGGTGGVYFVYGGGLANLITEHLEGYEATSETTSASVDNLLLVGDGSSDIAFTLADAAADAVKGEEAFEEPVPVQVLAQLYTSPTQIVAGAGSGIKSVEDLRGKRVSLGAPNSATEVIGDRIMEAAGMDPQADIERAQLSVAESADALADGTIDAFFWAGGVPTSAITDLATNTEIVLLPSSEYLAGLEEKYPDVYTEAAIPGGTYQGVEEEVSAVSARNFLVVNEETDEEQAYQITKLLFDHQADLAEVHPEAKNLNIENAQDIAPLELHPGAQRYYDEQG